MSDFHSQERVQEAIVGMKQALIGAVTNMKQDFEEIMRVSAGEPFQKQNSQATNALEKATIQALESEKNLEHGSSGPGL